MKNRTFLVLIVVLSCGLLLVGGAFIGSALYLQGRMPSVAFPQQGDTGALLATPAAGSGVPQAGMIAPDFTVQTLDGASMKLSDFRGKPVMLNFWASWCGPCTAEMKNIESVFQKHTNEDIVILGVNQGEGSSTVKGYAELWKLHFRLVRDEDAEASHLYQVRALPTTVFIDAQGKISDVHIGGPMTADFIEKRVNDLLGKGGN